MTGVSRHGRALAAAAGAAVMMLAGCSSVSSSLKQAGTSLKQVGAGARSGPPKTYSVGHVTMVAVDTAGTITVTGTSGSGPVKVTESASYSKTPPATSHKVAGSALTLGYTCKTEILCSVDYDITVPRGTAVQAKGREGTITLNSLSGPVTAKTVTGLISANGLTSPSARLQADEGGIDASFSSAPASVNASTNAGSIVLSVPNSAAYRIKSDALVGVGNVSVRRSPTSPHVITAHSDLGGITIDPS
ncbi:MAG: hypothetical protein FWE35_12950 [Streptosporangiales bacterium]|jgi:hypothetical protein|nr:hypothetical protein [Streptosporangiales bacterium]